MPIELWWWVKPLFETGYLTLIVFCVIGTLLEKLIPDNKITPILAVFAIAPWVIAPLSVVVWLLTNILIMIWR